MIEFRSGSVSIIAVVLWSVDQEVSLPPHVLSTGAPGSSLPPSKPVLYFEVATHRHGHKPFDFHWWSAYTSTVCGLPAPAVLFASP